MISVFLMPYLAECNDVYTGHLPVFCIVAYNFNIVTVPVPQGTAAQ
jgi:hypothetical protein